MALAFISVFLCKYFLYGAFAWARRALNHREWRFPARAVACDKKAPHATNACSLINANTSAADCDVSNDVRYASREALPAAAQAVIKMAGPRQQ